MDFSEPSILDVIYDVLEQANHPLSALEISAAAAYIGYDITAWEAAGEIEQHIDSYGPDSPFIQVGRRGYWLYYEPEYSDNHLAPTSNFLTPIAVVVCLVVIFFMWSILSSNSSSAASLLGRDAGAFSAAEILPDNQPVISSPVSLDLTWWIDNAVNQINPDTQSVARNVLSNYFNTCGPAVISMVVSYYRSQAGEENHLTPADVLIDAQAQLGYFLPPYNSGLLDFHNLDDLAGFYGLERVLPTGQAVLLTTEELLEGLREGRPAIAGMRYGYDDNRYVPIGGSGIYNHFVVVIGIQMIEEQEHVLVLNNHPGVYLINDADVEPVLMTLDQFEQSWLLKDGSENENYGFAAFYMPTQ